MTKFIWKKYLSEKKDGEFTGKSFTFILNIDVINSSFQKEVITVDIGTNAKSGFAKHLIIYEKQVAFKKECVAHLPMKALTTAVRSCRNAYHKKIYVKMHYKEPNQNWNGL